MAKKDSVKEAVAEAVDPLKTGTTSKSVGVSVPKEIWEKFIVDLQGKVKVHVEADGPLITKIVVENA